MCPNHAELPKRTGESLVRFHTVNYDIATPSPAPSTATSAMIIIFFTFRLMLSFLALALALHPLLIFCFNSPHSPRPYPQAVLSSPTRCLFPLLLSMPPIDFSVILFFPSVCLFIRLVGFVPPLPTPFDSSLCVCSQAIHPPHFSFWCPRSSYYTLSHANSLAS